MPPPSPHQRTQASRGSRARQISPKSRKIFLICAADEDNRDAWMEAIRTNAKPRSGAQGTAEQAAGAGSSAGDLAPEDVRNAVKGDESQVTLADFELLKVVGRGTYGKVPHDLSPVITYS